MCSNLSGYSLLNSIKCFMLSLTLDHLLPALIVSHSSPTPSILLKIVTLLNCLNISNFLLSIGIVLLVTLIKEIFLDKPCSINLSNICQYSLL